MYACDYLETGFLRGVTFAAPTKVYLALFLNDPGDSGAAGTEISYAGYARMEIAFSEPAASNGGIGIQNLSDITFAAPADPAGTVTHIAIMDSLVGGNMLARSELTESLVIGANEPLPGRRRALLPDRQHVERLQDKAPESLPRHVYPRYLPAFLPVERLSRRDRLRACGR